MTAPVEFGNVLMGRKARKPVARMNFRFYGTRDVALGLATMWAALRGENVAPLLGAGIASDLLDVTVMVVESSELPPEKRVPGLAAALSAAVVGAALLARRRSM
jgi:hypothetical protein